MGGPRPVSPKQVRRAGTAPPLGQAVKAGRGPGSAPLPSSQDPLASVWPFLLRISHVWVALIVGAVAGLAFLNSLGNGFAMDDQPLIVHYPLIRDLGNLKTVFTSPYWPKEHMDGMYRPLLVVSFALNYAVGGLNPVGYHLVNVLLHAGNSALVYGLVWQLFRQRGLALLTAAAFALHPIHTEAVANVVGRGELLAATFVFLAWLLYLHRDPLAAPGAPEGPSPRVRSLLLAGSVGSFALGLLSKEHAIVLPGLLLLSDALRVTQRMLTFSWAALVRTVWRRLLTVYPPYLLVAGAFLLVRTAVLGTFGLQRINWVLNPIAYADTPTRLLTALKVLGRELGLLLAPLTLSADYSYKQIPVAKSLLEPGVFLPLLSAGLIAWLLRRRAPAVPFGLLVFLVTILPVANLLFPIGSIMAERQLYLPSVGVCLALAGGVVYGVERLAARPAPRRLAWLPLGAFGLLLVFYAGKTVVRNQAWASDLSIWQATIATSPNSAKAHFSLAWALKETGDLEGARQAMEAALRIYPTWSEARRLVGVFLSMQGRWDEAIAAYQTSIRLDAQAPEPHYNLARAYEKKRLFADARRAFERAAELAPPRDRPELFLGIGDFLVRHGDLAAAERWFTKATQVFPDYVKAHSYLGYVYWKRGRFPEAKAAFERALRLDPDSVKAHEGLGLVLQAQGKEVEAQREFQHAQRGASSPEAASRDRRHGQVSPAPVDRR